MKPTHTRRCLRSRTVPIIITLLILTGTAVPVSHAGGINSEWLDIVLVLDTSASMGDPMGDTSRLEALKAAVLSTFILPETFRTNYRQIGIVGFSDTAHPILPLTTDVTELQATINNLVPTGGTDFGVALEAASIIYGGEERNYNGIQVVIFFTDDTSDEWLSWYDAEKSLRAQFLPVIFAVGLGSEVAPSGLTMLGDQSYAASSADDLARVLDSIQLSLESNNIYALYSKTVPQNMALRTPTPDYSDSTSNNRSGAADDSSDPGSLPVELIILSGAGFAIAVGAVLVRSRTAKRRPVTPTAEDTSAPPQPTDFSTESQMENALPEPTPPPAEPILAPPLSLALFVSYSRQDGAFVGQLVDDLERAGHDVWRDVDDIPPGASWDRAIQRALRECNVVLLVATPQAVASDNVMDEISYALDNDKPVIPLWVEPCEMPLRVYRAQRIDFQQGYDAGLEQLVRHLQAIAAHNQREQPTNR